MNIYPSLYLDSVKNISATLLKKNKLNWFDFRCR